MLWQAGFESGYYYDGDYTYDIADDYCVSWPVYPSFKNTMEVLKKQSVVPGSYMTGKNTEHKDRPAKPICR